MKIAVLTDGIYPLVLGGMQRHSYNMVKSLCQKGINVTLIHCRSEDQKTPIEQFFTASELAYLEVYEVEFPKYKYQFPGHYVVASYVYSKRISKLLEHKWDTFDFIYAKGFTAWHLIQQKIKQRGADLPPIGVKFHGYEMFQKQADFKSLLQSKLLAPFVKWNTLKADFVFSYGGKITPIIKHLGVDASRIIQIPSGIDSAWLNFSKHSSAVRKFVFVGRFERRKGVEELNNVIQALIDQSMVFEFHFIGPIPIQNQIQNAQVFYHGIKQQTEDLQALLDRMDVLVCPSWSEGMPNVIIEAMSRSCAVIATDVGAVNELVGSNTGQLIAAGHQAELMQSIIKFIQISEADLQSIQQNACIHIKQHFLYDHIIDQFILKINQAIQAS